MDALVIKKVMEYAQITPAQKLVLLAIAFAMPTGFPIGDIFKSGALKSNPHIGDLRAELNYREDATIDYISKMTNYTIRHIRDILRELIKRGMVERAGKAFVLSAESDLLPCVYLY